MTMKENGILLDRVTLENGLELCFYDQSRPVAGDRFLAQLLIDLPIPIDDTFFSEGEPEPIGAGWKEFKQQLASTVHYQILKTRHFVPRDKLELILKEIRQEFASTGFHYLQHPDFPRRYVRKVYGEWSEKERCRTAHTKAIQAAEGH